MNVIGKIGRIKGGDMKFCVGDKVKHIEKSGWFPKGFVGEITAVEENWLWMDNENKYRAPVQKKSVKLIGGKMSKYENLKERIEGLDDGWNKEADDILQEIVKEEYSIQIHRDRIDIYLGYQRKTSLESRTFDFSSQCEKHEAFKKALLWLLDHSDIKQADKKKEKKIDVLSKAIEKEAENILKLQKELDEILDETKD